MRFSYQSLALVITVLLFLNVTPLRACGPFSIDPIFVFKESPDLPFEEFTNGKIGIVQPTFGRKTLVIAYRYLNGSSFTSEEQKELIDALRGNAPEDKGTEAVKAWVITRKEFLKENEKLPEIYTERQSGGYDFFPNCTRNAFEVATETLKNRVTSYGAEDKNVRAWLAAQDTVFENCDGGTRLREELGPENPIWLRKDRDYQIAAALFYSLNFDEARRRFERIADDNDSPWHETAEYLVARTLVRQASLTENEARKHGLYEKAELELQKLMGRTRRFYNASQKLLALVKFRLRPQERIRELAGILANQSGNENLRQDLIDYVWLLDRFEARILEDEKKRKEALKPPEEREQPEKTFFSKEAQQRYEAIQRGELIDISLTLKKSDGTPDYSNYTVIDFKYDASEEEILQAFELKLGRKLTAEEIKEIKERHDGTLKYRQWLVSPNRKLDRGGLSQYEGCDYDCDRLTLDLVPEFLHRDELSDWIFSLQTNDPNAYIHALSKWRETDSRVWLLTALIKADKSSPSVKHLIGEAEKVSRDEPAFPTIAYHLVRLKAALGRKAEAQRMLDEIVSWQSGILPVSAQNQFIEQRMQMAENLTEFLKFSGRKPVAFYKYGSPMTIRDLLRIEKSFWNPEYMKQTREEYEQETEESYKDLLPWDDRVVFDEKTVDIFNWRIPLRLLAGASRNPAVPPYLQDRLILAAWTRAILLAKEDLALKLAPEVMKVAPETTSLMVPYINARNAKERSYAGLFVLLKYPNLSPFVAGGLPTFVTTEKLDYYFESAWWCLPPATEYNNKAQEVPKIVPKPGFLTASLLEEADREHEILVSIGDGKSYLGKLVIEWARVSPLDARIPEALFIAAKANESYKYGCNGWEADQGTKEAAVTILRNRYPLSPWTAKLEKTNN